MKNRTLHNAFPIVAAAIGNRFGIKVSVGGSRAYTDGQSIQLPAYEGDDPDYQDFAWGLLAHEAAHIRYSDFSLHYGRSVIRRRLCGAIEDVRIEHELAKDFPGTRLTLRTVVEKMIVSGGFVASSLDDHPANVLYGYVLKRLRARVLGQTALVPLVEQTELVLKAHFSKGAVTRLQGLLSEVPEGLTSESDCLQLTDRILTMIEQACEEQRQSNRSAASSSNDTDREVDEERESDSTGDAHQQSHQQDEIESSDSVEPGESNQAAQVSGDDSASSNEDGIDANPASEHSCSDAVDGNADDSSGDESDADTDSETASTGLGGNEADINRADPTQTWQALLSAAESDIEQDVFDTLKSVLSLAADQVSAYALPSGDEPPLDAQAGLMLLQKVQGESGKIRAALQGLVQSHRLCRSQPSQRGRRMDGRRLSRLPLGETKLFLRKQPQISPNTAIHLLLDKSESMGYERTDSQGQPLGSRMPIALEATLALALAFEGIPGVNTGVTAFPAQHDSAVYRLLEHGQRIRQRTGAFSLAANGSTPMTEAIWFGAAALLRCREPRKVLMVMTDGQPDDIVSTLAILQRCRDSGIETVGIGLGVDVSHLFPVALAINDLQELRTQLFDLSKAVLLAA